LSAFYGISIYMYWDDHNPPHYHAVYGEHQAWIVIANGTVLHGTLPTRGLRPHLAQAGVEVPRTHVIRLTFDDGVTRELEFLVGSNQGTVFAALDDPVFFAQVKVDPESRTVIWPNGLDLDPAVLHGDFEPAGVSHLRDVTPGTSQGAAGS